MTEGRPGRTLGTLVAWFYCLPMAAAPVMAQNDGRRPRVYLDFGTCDSALAERVRRVVNVELGTVLVDAPPPAEVDATRVTVECGPLVAGICVDDRVTGKRFRRRVRVESVQPRVRPRLLGLAIAELVALSWKDPSLPEESEDELADPSAARQTAFDEILQRRVESPELADKRLRLAIGASMRTFRSAGHPRLVGANLSLEHDLTERLGWGLDLVLEGARVPVSLGSVRIAAISAAPVALARTQIGFFVVGGGLGARIGLSRLTGAPSDSETTTGAVVSGSWAGPIAVLRATAKPVRQFIIAVGVESGFGTQLVRGRVGDQVEVAIEGFWFAGGLALGIAL